MNDWVDFALNEVTIVELQASMQAGQHSARTICELYLDRIELLNQRGPKLRAIIETNPDVLSIADELDAERASTGPRSALHGIPVVLKDNIDTADQMTTTAGSLALTGSTPASDAHIVAKLRHAGAVILAKANMSEWAYFRGTRATSGWSARGGQCRNPYALDRNPCGSSSGSAVAAAANLAAVAVGTETSGSIMCPSSINGVVGIKPTVGLVSRSGIIPISHSQDTAGPMARTVSDAAVLLGVLTGVDGNDSATAAGAQHAHSEYTTFLEPDRLRGARIGVARNFDGFHHGIDALFEAAIQAMKAAGAVIVDPANLTTTHWTDDEPLVVLEHEFKAGLNTYLRSLGLDAPIQDLQALISFNQNNAESELTHFGQQRLIASQARGSLDDDLYVRALDRVQRAARGDGIDALMDEFRLDALVAPTTDLAWPIDHIKGDPHDGGSSAGPAAMAGYPNISVPMGQVHGLPSGISFFGRAWSEPVLIGIAYAYEQATMHRTMPSFKSNTLTE